MKVAVVGSGIAGLTAAHYLSRAAEVHVFEAGAHIGGHTNTIDVETPSGRCAVGTGFIVFNDRTYPKFVRLMDALGVPSQPSFMSFSVKAEAENLEYNGTDLNRLFAQRRNFFRPSFYCMIADILRFNRSSADDLNAGRLPPELTLGRYLEDNSYSRAFMDLYIIPMGAATWSAPAPQMREFPAAYFVRFFKNHGMLSVNDRPLWRVIRGGSRSYVPALTRPFRERVHVNTPVRSVRREAEAAVLSIEHDGTREETRFDHVVMASHADQSLALLADATPAEREVLGAFSYQENQTLLHTDVSVLPRRRRAWASWNYLVPERDRAAVAVTYNMNILQSLAAPETFLVSLNLEDRVAPEKILRRLTYHHPVYTTRGVAAQARWSEVSGAGRTHYCGAYWGYGFHEDGVAAAQRVCESLGVRP